MDAFTAEEVPQTAEEVRRCSGPCIVAGGRATAVPILSLWRRERRQIDGIGRHKSERLCMLWEEGIRCSGLRCLVRCALEETKDARWRRYARGMLDSSVRAGGCGRQTRWRARLGGRVAVAVVACLVLAGLVASHALEDVRL